MNPIRSIARRSSLAAALVAAALCPSAAMAQVGDVVVGVTPTCPYGLASCWAGAYEALGRLEGVASVATKPDGETCTAKVCLKSDSLPDPEAWSATFKKMVGDTYGFRGVEINATGELEASGAALALRVPGLSKPLALAPLAHKLQWNFRKAAARQPEPDEAVAFAHLAAARREAKPGPFHVQVAGPLVQRDGSVVLEVRKFFPTVRAEPATPKP